jgi:lauroyl/myristoyl acyltransferase
MTLMRWLGTAIYHVSPLAEGVRDNFRHVLGPEADAARVSALAQRAFQGQLLNYYDMMWLSERSLDESGWRVICAGLEAIDRLVAENRGAVVVSGHVGPLEFMVQGVASMGYDIFAIFEHLDNERLFKYLVELRTTHGLHVISTKDSLIGAYRRIKRGEILLSAMDRDATNTGRVTELFGAPVWMPDGYARVAVRANVPILFGVGYYTDDGPQVKLYPPMYPDPSLSKEEAVTDLVDKTLRLFEEAVRADPGEWHLTTPVWKVAQERLQAGYGYGK